MFVLCSLNVKCRVVKQYRLNKNDWADQMRSLISSVVIVCSECIDWFGRNIEAAIDMYINRLMFAALCTFVITYISMHTTRWTAFMHICKYISMSFHDDATIPSFLHCLSLVDSGHTTQYHLLEFTVLSKHFPWSNGVPIMICFFFLFLQKKLWTVSNQCVDGFFFYVLSHKYGLAEACISMPITYNVHQLVHSLSSDNDEAKAAKHSANSTANVIWKVAITSRLHESVKILSSCASDPTHIVNI